ncbi:MAG: hypothetical protein ABID84_03575 [Chloroflexota bacterium]
MNTQDQRLQNKRTVRTQVCEECWGRLVEKHFDGQEVVVCAADPNHQGFISEVKAIYLKRQQRLQAMEVLSNYPQLNPSPLQETVRESRDSLFP